jgi:hypothetical protein
VDELGHRGARERRHEGGEFPKSRCEEVVERSDCDRHLSLQADRLARRGQALLHESIETLLFVPDLDDPKAEVGRSGQMEVDTAFGSSFDPELVHDGAVLVRRQAMDI